MKRAEKTAEDVMTKAIELGGVVSGEHGIGITKMKFLEKKPVDRTDRIPKKSGSREYHESGNVV